MKKFLLTICCSFFMLSTVFCQWSQLTTSLTGEIEAVLMHDVNTIIMATSTGIASSVNGGNSWTSILLGEITALSFVTSTIVYAAGDNGVVYKTTDGGFNWTLLQTGTTTKMRSLHFYNENIGAAAGESGVIIVTNDGGVTWTSPSSGTSVRLLTVFFNSATTGFIGGRDGILRKTTDSGNTWTTVNAGLSNDVSSIFFVNASTGFMAEEVNMYKTTDGGTSWNAIQTGNNNEINAIYFLNNNEGYAVGDLGTIIKTLDGGNTWNPENSPNINELAGVHFYNGDNGFAVGDMGTILKFSTATGLIELNSSRVELYPNPSRDYFIIQSDKQGRIEIEISNILGKKMAVINTEFNQNIRHGLKDAGIYIVKITAGNEKPVFKRLKVN